MNIQKAFGFEQKEIDVRGKKYTLQNMPYRAFYQLQDRCKDKNGVLMITPMYDAIFKDVIISPKVNWENFDDLEELEELMKEVTTFLTGKKPIEQAEQE